MRKHSTLQACDNAANNLCKRPDAVGNERNHVEIPLADFGRDFLIRCDKNEIIDFIDLELIQAEARPKFVVRPFGDGPPAQNSVIEHGCEGSANGHDDTQQYQPVF